MMTSIRIAKSRLDPRFCGENACPFVSPRAAVVAIALLSVAALGQVRPRTVELLDKGWEFYPLPDFKSWPSEQRLTVGQINQLTIPHPGDGWKSVNLPDDYVVRGTFSEQPNAALLAGGAVCAIGGRECEVPSGSPPAPRSASTNNVRSAYGGHGYLPVYPAWYQRTVLVPASAKDKTIWLEFGGIYRDAAIFINGKFVEQHPSGYTTFRLNVTSNMRLGEENTISVFVDPRWFEGWWYEGGGIYRHVRLIVTNSLQVAPWGTFVLAELPSDIRHAPISGDRAAADLNIETTIRNDLTTEGQFTLVSEVLDGNGTTVVASLSSAEQVSGGQEQTFKQSLKLRDALLWSIEHPNLYRLRTTIRQGNKNVDQTLTSFGIRKLRFDPEKGLFLNDRHVEIHGVANHQDFPGVGLAAPDNLWAWRIQKLKAMGANAYRTAHNPLGEEFYDAADRLGMLVMDETRHLGDTYAQKATDQTPYSDLSDLKSMVLQHRNHPSVIMWSLANEEGQQRTKYGAQIFAAMKAAVHELDPTRPTTSAMNGGFTKEGFISVEDLLGMNYHNAEFAKVHQEFSNLMIFGSEDINAKTSRGTRDASPETGQCSEFGDDAPGGQPWNSWVPVVENPYVGGEFIWTGFDYRGEPNPFSWPAVTSQVGAMDLCGFPKPVYHYWEMVWHQRPSVYVFPDWNYRKSDLDKEVRVRVLSNTREVELLLNGKSLGTKQVPRENFVDWKVPYAPGTLTAVGRSAGREVARYSIKTTGAPAAVRLVPELEHLAADGEQVMPIRVEVVDAQDRVVSDADNLIRFSISGAGSLVGVGNGDPASHESNVANQRSAFRGLTMVLVRASDHPGTITVQAQAKGLPPERVAITTAPAGQSR
jgi:beta-galactosidase